MAVNKQYFHLQEWTPKTFEIAREIIQKINSATPELEVLFMGAAALQLPGKNDIDLDILCKTADITHYTKLLVPILGKPKSTGELTAWNFTEAGFEIDCMLSDPATSHVPMQKKIFDLLKTNQILRDEYEQLKRSCDGLPYEEYDKQKNAFFASISV